MTTKRFNLTLKNCYRGQTTSIFLSITHQYVWVGFRETYVAEAGIRPGP